MKVKISNLGVLEQAEINLKPLTIFVGANSTGKTWTAYALASIFSQHGFDKYIKAYNNNKTHIKYELLEDAVESLLQLGNTQIDLIEFTKKYADKYINNVSSQAPDWISEFLNTDRVAGQMQKIHPSSDDILLAPSPVRKDKVSSSEIIGVQ